MSKKLTKAILCFALIIALSLLMTAVVTASEVKEDEIESISIGKVTLIENFDGYTDIEEDKEFFRYNTDHPELVTLKLKSGKTITDEFEKIEDYYGENATFSDSQSAVNPWSKGSYTATFSFMGHEGSYEVEIVENPVERITVTEKSLYYLSDGFYDPFSDGDKFYYDSAPDEMTVYFKDGSTISGTAESFYELTGYFADVTDSQNETSWGIGKYKCRVEYMGVGANYYVSVKESPVKSIRVDTVTLYEGIDGVWASEDASELEGKVFLYDAKPEKITVFYKNGTAITGSVEEIEKETGYDVVYDTGMEWSYGKYTASVSFLGASTKFVADVKQSPVKDVRLITAPAKTDYYAGELFDLSGAGIRVYYANGKTEDVTVDCSFEKEQTEVVLGEIGKTVKLDSFVEVGYGVSDIYLDFLDSFLTVDVNVREETFSGVALSADSNGFPVLTFTLDNGSKLTAKVLNMVGEDFYGLEQGDYSEVLLITDKGNFKAVAAKRYGGYAFEFFSQSGQLEALSTNVCDGINPAEVAMTKKAKIIFNNYDGIDSYNGLVASDNVDALLSFAASISKAGKPKEIHKDYYVYTVTEIHKSVTDFFDVDGIDVALSRYFDARTNTVKIRILDSAESDSFSNPTRVEYPVSYVFKDGYFKVTYNFENGKKMQLTADQNGRIASYKVVDALVHKHVMVTIAGISPTFTKTGLTEGVKCSSCGEILTEQQVIAKLVLGKTSKIASAQNNSAIKLAWAKVSGATGYEVFYKTATGWKNCSTSTATSVTFGNLPAGRKYVFAVRAYAIESGKLVKATGYTTFETATKPLAPSKAVSKQNDSAIKITWAASAGATGYRVYYKASAGWKALGETANTSALFSGLKQGTRYTFAIKPFIITSSGVIWCDSYTQFVAATIPGAPSVKASSPSTGKISLTYSTVSGAEAYQVFYKTGDGAYKLYKNYSKAGTLDFSSLKSGTKYTFAVRAAKNTSGGWIFGMYNTSIVTVK